MRRDTLAEALDHSTPDSDRSAVRQKPDPAVAEHVDSLLSSLPKEAREAYEQIQRRPVRTRNA